VKGIQNVHYNNYAAFKNTKFKLMILSVQKTITALYPSRANEAKNKTENLRGSVGGGDLRSEFKEKLCG